MATWIATWIAAGRQKVRKVTLGLGGGDWQALVERCLRWTLKGLAGGEHRATILHRSIPGGDEAVGGGPMAVSSLSAAFFDPSRHLGGSCVRGIPFTEIILVTGATLRTVMSRCGELVQTSRGILEPRNRRTNTDAV